MKSFNKVSKTGVLKFIFFSILLIFAAGSQVFSQKLNLDQSFSGGVSDAPAAVFISATQADGKILVGGDFSFANGIKKPFLARLNSDGTLDSSFNANGSGADDSVYEIKILANGKILIGGAFRTYNNVSKSGLARLNADGSLDASFNPNGAGVSAIGTVRDLALQADGKILIAGENITTYNGVRTISVARINQDGTLDTNFNSPFTLAYPVEEIEIQTDGKILVGGTFILGNPYPVNLARLNANGTIDNTFNPNGNGANLGIHAMRVLADDKILIGGDFTSYNGNFVRGFARLNKDGTLDAGFSNGQNGAKIEYIDVQTDGKILIAGRFADLFTSGFAVRRLNANGTIDNSFRDKLTNNTAYSVKAQADGKIILTGLFTEVDGKKRGGIVRYNFDGTVDSSFGTSFKGIGIVEAIAVQADGKILVGGSFGKANGTTAFNLVRFNKDGTLDGSFNIGSGANANIAPFTSVIQDIAVQADGKILVSGNFSRFNEQTIIGIVRLNADGTIDSTFNSPFTPFDNFSNASDILIQSDGKIMLGGSFTAGFNPITGIVRLNSDGTLDRSFSVSMTGSVLSIARQTDGKYLLGGNFVRIGDIIQRSIARLNDNGSLDASFNPGFGTDGTVQDIEIQPDGKILIGGNFRGYNGVLQSNLTRANADGSLDTTFKIGTGANAVVYEIFRQADGKVLIGGDFTSYNGNQANKLARINADGSFDSSFVSGFDADARNSVREIVKQADGGILVGGVFTSYNNVARNSLLRLTVSNTARTRFDYDGDGRADVSVFRPSNSVWYLNRTTDGFSAVGFGIPTDKPAPADFDGDGKTDIAVFRNGTWYLLRSTKGFAQIQFGAAGDIPVPADFDGDGTAELAVYRGGVWYSLNLVTNQANVVQFGIASDAPLIGDFDGDGKSDYAVYRPSNGVWYLLQSSNGFTTIQFGISIDKPAPADFDGDGKTDAAVFRNGIWYQLNSTSGVQIVQFGTAGDKPTPNAFIK